MSINESWSVRTLQERMETMLFERTAISQKPEETILNELKTLENEKLEKQILELNEKLERAIAVAKNRIKK